MLIAINKASAGMGISSRTLRYWEAAGLFKSVRDAQSGWRMYDDYALQCIRITCLLRRLDISVRDIKKVMDDRTVDSLCHVLKKQLNKLDQMGSDLGMLRAVILDVLATIEGESLLSLPLLEDMLVPVTLERKKHVISKYNGGFTMENVKTKYDEIKLVKMAPARAVAFSHVGIEPEDEAYGAVQEWLDKNNLNGTARIFGFNVEPYPTDENPGYGFGFCATIPEGAEISAPLYEMRLPGGTYALMPDDGGGPEAGWKKVIELCNDSEWGWTWDGDRDPGLEEHIYLAEGGPIINIMFPVKRRVGG